MTSITSVSIHITSSASVSYNDWLVSLKTAHDNSQVVFFQITEVGSNNIIGLFRLNGVSVSGNVYTITTASFAGGGTITNSRQYTISWVYNGKGGTSGTGGTSGSSGSSGTSGPSTVLNATDTTTGVGPYYPVFISTAGTNTTPLIDTTGFQYNATTNTISATAASVNTVNNTSGLTHYIPFVGDNNTPAQGEVLGTNFSLTYTPSSGQLTVGGAISGNSLIATTGSIQAANNVIRGGYTAHAAGTTAMSLNTNNVVRVTPNANATYTTTVANAGTICTIIIITSGTTSYTITFGTGFRSVGTLATGTVTGRAFTITFASDGTSMFETSRIPSLAGTSGVGI